MNSKRYKRSLPKGAGTLYKEITGNVEAPHGEYFTGNNKLKQLRNKNLLKNQLSMTQSVIKNFRENL